MDNTFNDLFDKFFNNKKKSIKKANGDINDFINEKLKKVMEILSNNPIDENTEKKIIENLGKPDKTEFFEEDGLFFERRTWHTPQGDIVELIGTSDPSLITPPRPEKSLKLQLEEAVNAEEYEKAAAIRDKIEAKNMDRVNKVMEAAKKRNTK